MLRPGLSYYVAQKTLEYTKRAVGSLFENMKVNRMLMHLMSGLRIKFKDMNNDQIVLKWYPPYVITVTPTSVSGGLGMPVVGINQNDILMLKLYLKDKVSKAVHTLSLIRFNDIDDLHNAIMKTIIGMYEIPKEVKHNLTKGYKDIGRIKKFICGK